jgi:hypothetical protein
MRVGDLGPFERRQCRRQGDRAHVHPDHAGFVDGLVGRLGDLLGEAAPGRLVRHIDAATISIELPAVVHASQAIVFVATPEQVRVAVRAPGVEDGRATAGGAEGDEVFAQQPQAHGGAIGFGELLGEHGRQPVAAEQVAHRRAGADLGDVLVFLAAQHVGVDPPAVVAMERR